MNSKLVKQKEAFPFNYHKVTVIKKDNQFIKMEDAFNVNIPKIQNEKTLYLLFYKQICS